MSKETKLDTNNQSEIHKDHRKRMKDIYFKNGLEAFSDIEKLEFILYFAISRKDTNPIAHRLLKEFGSFDKVLEAPVEKLMSVEGVGEHAAILLSLFLKATASYGLNRLADYVGGTKAAKEYCHNLFRSKRVEEFYVICLTSANRVTECKRLSVGTISEVPVDIRKLTNVVLLNDCERVIIAHNHPLGMPRPSDEDISFTSRIIVNCILNNVELLDHIIVSGDKVFSFEESGLLKELKHDAVRKVPFDKQTSTRFGQSSSNYKIG